MIIHISSTVVIIHIVYILIRILLNQHIYSAPRSLELCINRTFATPYFYTDSD